MAIATNQEFSERAGSDAGLRTERRIAWLTLLIGLMAGAAAALAGNWFWASGLMIGAGLAWLNFRWLRTALDALVIAATAQAGAEKPRVPVGTYLRALLRYALIAFFVYVIFRLLKVPLASMVVGLCSLAGAALAASVYEILRSEK